MPRTGEQIQQLGDHGSQRAKRWLESTCRAEVKWNNPTIGIRKLQYRKAGAASDSDAQGDFFSFDLGGALLGGDCDGELFVAESKKYASAGDQGTEYRKFISKCYRVEVEHAQFYDHFLWITWAPFLVNSWDHLLTSQYVETAATGDDTCKYIALGASDFDPVVGSAVARKILIVVLADGQEAVLSLHGDELMHVRKALLEFRAAT
ncbi:MAG: hypothetical protein QOD63_2875 [Actinomycetota bacterium]|jgi:hypothetical protein|nr:hypothetical protein [Actinomycetota bacterium]